VGKGNQKSHPDSSCLQWKETLLKVFFAFSSNFQLEIKSKTTTL